MRIDNYLIGPPVIIAFVLMSTAGVFMIRKIKGIQHALATHHEVMGFFFPLAGSIYGVLLGLVVVNSMTLFNTAQNTVSREATSIVAIHELASHLPHEEGARIKKLCRAYVSSVIENEWTSMDMGSHHPKARTYAVKLFDEIIRTSKLDATIGPAILESGQDIWKARNERINTASTSIPAIEWFVLCVGGILVILFSYMFVMDNLLVQLLGTVILSTMIALNIFLVVLFGSPFAGDLRVNDFPLRNALAILDEIDRYASGIPPAGE